jgi:hypothetical protein
VRWFVERVATVLVAVLPLVGCGASPVVVDEDRRMVCNPPEQPAGKVGCTKVRWERTSGPSAAFTDVSPAMYLPSSPQPGSAPPSREALEVARLAYEQAAARYAAGTPEALEESASDVARAYRLAPIGKLLFVLGELHARLDRSASALTLLEAYLERADPPAERLQRIQERVSSLRARTASLSLVRPDVQVTLDGIPLPAGSEIRLVVDPKPHVLEAIVPDCAGGVAQPFEVRQAEAIAFALVAVP